ncbi:MAG: NTP transferase domain-containing protein, partial [Candidatus Diapherotrites archaeon]|nr:NTP transferase domain-containing protein [Candidatus Diapherotrites archaeon]
MQLKVIIPAAGYATRLYPLTEDRPKALLEVKGKPLIEHIVARIGQLGNVEEIFVVTNDRFYPVFAEWLQGFESKTGLKLKILNDGTASNEDRLGQVGDIQLVIEKENIDDELLVVAGDNLFNFSLRPAFDFFREKRTIVNALWDSKSIEVAQQQGIAVPDETGKFVEFQEKAENPKTTLTSL